jgi:glutathione S-transferase
VKFTCEGVEASRMLELYQSEGCPHCTKVREKLSELGVSYVIHNPRLRGNAGGDVTNERTHEELEAGGADQIPYLVDTAREEARYESDDIVEYLDEHYA